MSVSLLVTGGFGYVGGRLLTSLRDRRSHDLRTSTRRPASQWPAWADGIRVIQAGLDDPAGLDRLCEGVDTIVHLAAMNAGACAADPEQAREINVEGTRRLIGAAERANVRRVIYFSTAHVYAAPLVGRITEAEATTNTHPYAATHRAAEEVVLGSAAVRGLVLRLSNAFGAPADSAADCWMLLVNDLCRQAVLDRRLVLRGSGVDRRDFITMEDVVAAVCHFLDLPDSALGDGLFNLGRGQSRSTLDMAELVAGRCESVLGYRPPVSCQASPPDRLPPDLDYRIDRLLETGFVPVDDAVSEVDATLALCREGLEQ